MKTVFTTGTFDLYHYGHLNLLKRAKERGDYLIVGLNSDELISHKKPINDYETRKNCMTEEEIREKYGKLIIKK